MDPARNDVTDIIPFDEFDGLYDLDFSDSTAFAAELQLLSSPDLDDLQDVDDLTPLRLIGPSADDAAESPPQPKSPMPRRGQHRKPATGPVKGRILIAAMAAGAAAAAAHSAITSPEASTTRPVLAAQQTALGGAELPAPTRGMQMVTVKPAAASAAVHNEEFAKGVAFAQERAEREARLQRPLFVMPTRGMFTSNFGYRWGTLHGGIDIANSIGTPILAVTDGVVIDAGPAGGYGMLVKLRHFDGTVTLYGHVNTTTVSVGERVMAGDQIATMGNRGNSTGPHLHFEVLLDGSQRIDPVPWLAKRGISV